MPQVPHARRCRRRTRLNQLRLERPYERGTRAPLPATGNPGVARTRREGVVYRRVRSRSTGSSRLSARNRGVADVKFAQRFARSPGIATLNHRVSGTITISARPAGLLFAKEFVDGVNLRQAMKAVASPGAGACRRAAVCEALQYAMTTASSIADQAGELLSTRPEEWRSPTRHRKMLNVDGPDAPAGEQPAGTPQYMAQSRRSIPPRSRVESIAWRGAL